MCLRSIVFMANEYEKTIKDNLTARRRGAGLTQAALAEKIGIDRNTYRNIESGSTMMLNPHLPAICRELGCTLEELLLGYDPTSLESNPHLSDVKAAYGNRYEVALQDAARKNDSLQAEIDGLRERVEALSDMVRDKTDLIAFLKEQNRRLQDEISK